MSDDVFHKYFGNRRDLAKEEIAVYYKGANDFRVWILHQLIDELTTNIHWSEDMVFELANRIGLSREPYFILGQPDSEN
jgi:hypothetical protein